MKHKGFTMIELLTVLVILGIVSTIAVVGVTSLTEKSRKESDIQLKNTLVEAAKSYANENSSIKPIDVGSTSKVTAQVLKDKNYLKKDIINSKQESCMENSYVKITKKTASDYDYEAFLYCGKDKPPAEEEKDKPYIEAKFVDSKNVEAISTSQVKDVRLVALIKGSATDETVGVASYNYIIYIKTNSVSINEIYNSGNIAAKGAKHVDINHDLSEYIDVTENNNIYVKITAINTLGASNTYSNDSSMGDSIPPVCELLDPEIAPDDWLRKADIDSGKTRVRTVSCEDDKGSGCIRPTYTTTWPNQKEQSAEFGTIELKDNAGNVGICKVRINIDTIAPKIEVTSPALSRTVVADNDNDYARINADDYNNLVNSWVNKENYDQGLVFTVNLSDDIKLGKYDWVTNGDSSEKQSGNIDGTTKTITIKLFSEGRNREGKLTVYDRAGNSTKVTIRANIDITPPTISVLSNDNYYYSLTATATDNASMVSEVGWDATGYMYVGNLPSCSYSLSGITSGTRTAYAKDTAGNVGATTSRAYKIFERLTTNSSSRAYRIDDTIAHNCSKGADYSDAYKDHPWKKYGMDYYDCQCSYDYYSGAYYTYLSNQRRTGFEGHWSRFMVAFYQNNDNGVSACKGGTGNNPKNSYIYDLCVDGTYPPNSAQKSFHGYIWYGGAVPAGGYASWHKKGWYHDNGDRNYQVPYGSTVGTACAHSCQVAGALGIYAGN